MKKESSLKLIRIRTVIIFIVSFLLINAFVHMLFYNQKKEAELKAEYTAEATVRRIESQLDKYLTMSDFFKRMIEDNNQIDDDYYAYLAEYILGDNSVVEGIELAKDGIVNQAYPYESNKEAIGLNMLTDSRRQKEANLARESGDYTIAGPYELVQGGTGALLFDPIYVEDGGNRQFWGFAILVINWDKFIDEMQLERLEKASYHYRIWKNDMSGEHITIAQCSTKAPKDELEVECNVPNDCWYFDIAPENGWLSKSELLLGTCAGIILSVLVTIAYWQFQIRRFKERQYAIEIENAARKAQDANAAKTRFLFNMSHDIRTPMNAIIGFTALLEKHIDDKEKVSDYISKIESSSEMLLSIINHVLEMSRIESGKMTLDSEVVDLYGVRDSLTAVFEPAVRNKRLIMTYDSNIKNRYVRGDETKIKEILLNVISNSVKYTKRGGRIDISATEMAGASSDTLRYKVVVADTGIGMSKEYLPHIFETFTRERTSTEAKVDGTGLGLPIVKSLLDLMGGDIKVDSELGKGTTITITVEFPIAMKEELAAVDKKDAPKHELMGKRILLAEDNDLNAEIAITLLSENGFAVERARDGAVCVNMVKEKPADYYNLILMDIQMPNKNGYKASEEIRNLEDRRAFIPIIAMTANAFDEDKQKAAAAGMNGYIAKPIDVNVLINTIDGKIM